MGSVTGNDLRRGVFPIGTYNVNVLVGGERGSVNRVAFEFPDVGLLQGTDIFPT